MYYTGSSMMVVRESKNGNDNNSIKSNTDTGTTDTSNTDADSARRSLDVVDDVPISTLHSCDELRSKRTRVRGVAGALLLDFDIVCPQKRVLEVADNLLIMSNKPDLPKGRALPCAEEGRLDIHGAHVDDGKTRGGIRPAVHHRASRFRGNECRPVGPIAREWDGGKYRLEEGHALYTASTITFFMQNQQQEEQQQQQQQLLQQQNDNIDNDNLGISRSTAVEPPHSIADIIEKEQQQQQQQQDNNKPSISRSTAEPLHSFADTNEQQQQQ
ncbi:unnamed protein product [Ectocarpus sp. 13 AM-2016]